MGSLLSKIGHKSTGLVNFSANRLKPLIRAACVRLQWEILKIGHL